MLCTMTVTAQDYYDDYGYDVAENVYLTGNQWHTDGYSYLEAGRNYYLIIAGNNRFYQELYRPNLSELEVRFGDVIVSCRPYYYGNCLGWYIMGKLRSYFFYPDGRWCCLSFRPVYYDYHYDICGVRHINFYHWHFWSGRHHHHYHGTCYQPPVHRHGRPPIYRERNAPPPKRYGNSHVNRPRSEAPVHRVNPQHRDVRRDHSGSYRRSDNSYNNRSHSGAYTRPNRQSYPPRQQGSSHRGRNDNSSRQGGHRR